MKLLEAYDIFCLWTITVLVAVLLCGIAKDASHSALGSKAHACFANHTCRDGLRCLVADGLQEPGVCVKP